MNENIKEYEDERSKLFGSLLTFTQVFFKLRTGRPFLLSNPTAREIHFISICRQLMRVFRGELDLLVINVPPRYGKTELLIHFVAWAMARYPDCNFLYASCTYSLAARASAIIRDIMLLPEYKELFLVTIKRSSSAKHDFETTEHGNVYASGLSGTIVGRGAGIKGIKRFGGVIIIDDAHQPDEVHSDVIREKVNDNYPNTLLSRRNDGNRTPIISIGQRLHEDDQAARLVAECERDKTGRKVVLSLPGLDATGNALYPEMHTKEELLTMQAEQPYMFAAQIQQNPQPAGGGIFKRADFALLDSEPKILATLITVDTAETDKDCNDKTVFSFWGVYEIDEKGKDTGIYALHWINCWELSIEPKDLEDEFGQFYITSLRHPVKPSVAAIEKKSTGVTLYSSVKAMRGLKVLGIERTAASGNKTTRFLSMQQYVSRKQISLTRNAKHTEMCIKHMAKITNNNTHRFDDICDTAYDAVKLCLIDQTFIKIYVDNVKKQHDNVAKRIMNANKRRKRIRAGRKW